MGTHLGSSRCREATSRSTSKNLGTAKHLPRRLLERLSIESLSILDPEGGDARLEPEIPLKTDPPSFDNINEVLWSMLGQGLLYIDISH